MQRIYRLLPSNNSTVLALPNENYPLECLLFDGKPKSHWWSPLPCHLHKPKKYRTTFARFCLIPVCAETLLIDDTVLASLVGRSCEYLQLVLGPSKLVAIHVIKTSDCLDRPASRIAFVDNDIYRFCLGKVPFGEIFTIEGMTSTRFVASDSNLPPEEDFYQWYHKQGYTGLDFKLLWQSEEWGNGGDDGVIAPR